jgi:mRNA interferase RelE/StbE
VYSVHLSRRAQKDLLSMQKKDARRIRAALNGLAAEQDPRTRVKKLKGHEDVPVYSLRIGPYRSLLAIDNRMVVIFVITIEKRDSVYRSV